MTGDIGGYYVGGWTCNECGAYVPSGVTHMHYTYPSPYPYNQPNSFPYFPIIDNTALIRIAEALERIANILEKKSNAIGEFPDIGKDRE